MLFSRIDEFATLLKNFNIDDVKEQHRLEWIGHGNPRYRLGHGVWVNERNAYKWVDGESPHEIQGYVKCPVHGLYLIYFGCFLCKN